MKRLSLPSQLVSHALLAIALAGLVGCSDGAPSATPGCRANLGSIEILEVYESDQALHVAGVVQHNCSTPTGIRARFQFFDSAGQLLAVRTATLTDDMALPAATPKDFDWQTPMIASVDSVTAMVIELSRTDVMTVD
jgi:hypothetical protein